MQGAHFWFQDNFGENYMKAYISLFNFPDDPVFEVHNNKPVQIYYLKIRNSDLEWELSTFVKEMNSIISKCGMKTIKHYHFSNLLIPLFLQVRKKLYNMKSHTLRSYCNRKMVDVRP